MLRYLAFYLVLVCGSCYGINNQNQLDNIVEQIKNLKSGLEAKHSKRDSLQQELNKIDTEYGEASRDRHKTTEEVQLQKRHIRELETTSLLNQKQIQIQQNALSDQLRLFYILQRQGITKIILSQEDISHAQRLLYYYRSLNDYRINNIKKLQNSLSQINDQQHQLYSQYQALQNLQQKQQNEERNLAVMKNNRSHLIESINQNIADQNQRLLHLTADKKRLEQH